MTIKWFKSPFSCVIFLLTQPQVANQQKNIFHNFRTGPFFRNLSSTKVVFSQTKPEHIWDWKSKKKSWKLFPDIPVQLFATGKTLLDILLLVQSLCWSLIVENMLKSHFWPSSIKFKFSFSKLMIMHRQSHIFFIKAFLVLSCKYNKINKEYFFIQYGNDTK